MSAPFVYANPGERRNQSRPGWDDSQAALDRLERIVPPVFNGPSNHRLSADATSPAPLSAGDVLPVDLQPAPGAFRGAWGRLFF